MRQSQFRLLSLFASFIVTAFLGGACLAPAGALAAAAAAADATVETGLEEITVTAEKYNSTIQNTPISLSALSGEQLDAAGTTSVEAVAPPRARVCLRAARA